MSNTIRELLKARQQGGLPDMKTQFAQAAEQSQASPIPLDENVIADLYRSLMGPSMAERIMDEYRGYQERSNMHDIIQGKPVDQNPMVKTVSQVDR